MREGGEATIAEVYRTEGAEAAASAVGQAVTAAAAEHVEVDDARWRDLVAPVGGLEVSIDAPVGEWEAGRVELRPEDVGAFLAARAEGESELERVERQLQFWNAWLPQVAAGGEDVLPGEVETGIGRFVRGVARGEGSAAALPVAVGPIVSEDLDRPLRLVFDPALSPPQDRMLRMDGGTLVLPTTYGRTRAEPARIGLNCRDGRVVSVRYSGGGGAATTFTVAGAAQAGRATEN